MGGIKKKSCGQSGDDGSIFLRTKKIEMLVNEDEFENIYNQYLASSVGSLSKFCREKLLATSSGLTQSEIKNQHNELMYEIQKIGNNLNQIAKKVNGIKTDYPELLHDLTLEFEEIKKTKIRLLNKSGGKK
jgi:hypothetical protein